MFMRDACELPGSSGGVEVMTRTDQNQTWCTWAISVSLQQYACVHGVSLPYILYTIRLWIDPSPRFIDKTPPLMQ